MVGAERPPGNPSRTSTTLPSKDPVSCGSPLHAERKFNRTAVACRHLLSFYGQAGACMRPQTCVFMCTPEPSNPVPPPNLATGVWEVLIWADACSQRSGGVVCCMIQLIWKPALCGCKGSSRLRSLCRGDQKGVLWFVMGLP